MTVSLASANGNPGDPVKWGRQTVAIAVFGIGKLKRRGGNGDIGDSVAATPNMTWQTAWQKRGEILTPKKTIQSRAMMTAAERVMSEERRV